MLSYITLIFVCQLLGEFISGALTLPVPGPVIGMVLLFLYLLVRRQVPEMLGQVSNGLLRSMSLLFVPAGTGIMLHFRLLGESILPLGLALVVSTVVTIVITGRVMQALGKDGADG